MQVKDPPSFIISTEAQKAAFFNGYRLEQGIEEGWLRYASTTAPGEIAIAAGTDTGPWHLRLTHTGAAHELGSSLYSFDKLSDLYDALGHVYRLSISLPDAPLERFRKETAALPNTTEAERLVIQRLGQNVFRSALMEYWNSTCPLTGITEPALLRASHIVPWSDCDSDAHRLDVHNGLLLSGLWDLAFDGGLLSFSDEGNVLASPKISGLASQTLGLNKNVKLSGITLAHRANLKRHRKLHGFPL